MSEDTIMDFIEWLEDEKNVYLVDMYYHNKNGGGMFDSLDEVRSLVEEFAQLPSVG